MLLSYILLLHVIKSMKVEVLVAQLCLILCNPMKCNSPGSSVHGIFQARIMEWVAIPFFREASWPRGGNWVSCFACRFFTIWATRKATIVPYYWGFPGGISAKESTYNARGYRDTSSTPGQRRSPGGGDGNPFQCSCLENSMDRGAWWAVVYGVAKSQTRLSTHIDTPLIIDFILNSRFSFKDILEMQKKKKF